jgi:crotonobetainyl-CoA:carnitine CoA-transferase CaiB-like acyl-CoA transferase
LVLGLDLQTEVGAELFGRLVAGADAVFANFKPGTLAGLGFSYESLRPIGPAAAFCRSQGATRRLVEYVRFAREGWDAQPD